LLPKHFGESAGLVSVMQLLFYLFYRYEFHAFRLDQADASAIATRLFAGEIRCGLFRFRV
jgi:hypothetical protein